jgi:hypothetical protein
MPKRAVAASLTPYEAFLPSVDHRVVSSLVVHLRARRWSQRPPLASARILALIVRLWDDGIPFPTRPKVAAHLGVSVPAVDLVLRRLRPGIIYQSGVATVRGKRWVVPPPDIALASRPTGGGDPLGHHPVAPHQGPALAGQHPPG